MASTIWNELLGQAVAQRYYWAAGVRTRVIEAGSGPCLVLLHGMGAHADVFMRNVKSLSEHFRVIVPDLIGHGLTDKPTDREYVPPVYAEHLEALLDALGEKDAYFAGTSLGAWVATWLAAHSPSRVKKLVIATPGNLTNNPETMARIRTSSLQAVETPNLETARKRLEWLFTRPEEVTEEIVSLRYQLYNQPGMRDSMERVMVLQTPEYRERYGWDQRWVSQVQCPVRLIWTRQDFTASLEQGETLASWFRQCELLIMENTGKWPQWEEPEAYNRLHIDFLKADRRPGGP